MFENTKKVASKLIYAVPVAVFLGFVFYITTMTYTEEQPGEVQKVVRETKFNFDSYVALSKKFESVVQKNVFGKYQFINLNGLATKGLGINTLNGIWKLANGHLTSPNDKIVTVNPLARNVIELNNFLKSRNIDFVYVLAPSKTSFYDARFAPGYSGNSEECVDNMVTLLKQAGVNTIDMNAWFKENGWKMGDVFWETDHHWRPRAGLVSAQNTMELLSQSGKITYKKEWLKEENYRIEILKNWFLGSRGKRTGIFYAGVNDIEVYFPKFSTNYTYAALGFKRPEWSYGNSILSHYYFKKRNYFESDPYYIYLYGNNPMQIVTNTEGCNAKRALIIGDSFKQTWAYFLTTQFQEIYFVDLRNYTDGTLAQCVGEIQPDVVLMCSNDRGLLEKPLYTYGVSEYVKALTETNQDEPTTFLGDFSILSQPKNNNNFVSVGTNLKSGQTYTLTIDGIEIMKGNPRHIQITLQNQTTNNAVVNHYFEISKRGKQRWLFAIPNKQNNYGLYLYAGTKGRTAGNSINVTNIQLREGLFETEK